MPFLLGVRLIILNSWKVVLSQVPIVIVLLRPAQCYMLLSLSGTGWDWQVQEGKDLLSPPDREEQALLVKGGLPARWRLSCKTIVGKDNVPGTVRVKAVPQTEWREERSGK